MASRERADRFAARLRTAAALAAAGRDDEAIAALRKLLALAPTHVDALVLLGGIEGRAGRAAAALPLLARAAALRPSSAAVHNNLGNVLASLGREEEALAAFDRSLALRPDHAPTLHNRARALLLLRRHDEALAAIDRALALDPLPADAHRTRAGVLSAIARADAGEEARARAIAAWHDAVARGCERGDADFALAALGAGETPPNAPRAYVERLFDRYATRFDGHLRDELRYRVPELLVAELRRHVAAPLAAAVDLGCGTGLCGPLVAPLAARLVGVDLSANMLEQARARGCYDALVHADLVEHLANAPAAYDLAVAADVVNYVGDLQPFAAAAFGALRPGGVLAFSIEHHGGSGMQLQPSRRYAHGDDHLQAAAASAGFTPLAAVATVLREDAGVPVEGRLVVWRR